MSQPVPVTRVVIAKYGSDSAGRHVTPMLSLYIDDKVVGGITKVSLQHRSRTMPQLQSRGLELVRRQKQGECCT